jgi:hypothetical protein
VIPEDLAVPASLVTSIFLTDPVYISYFYRIFPSSISLLSNNNMISGLPEATAHVVCPEKSYK